MNLNEKIELLQAARDGKIVQARLIDRGDDGTVLGSFWNTRPGWNDVSMPDRSGRFNFGLYDYRIKPDLATITSVQGEKYEVKAYKCGDIKVGCQTFRSGDFLKLYKIREEAMSK